MASVIDHIGITVKDYSKSKEFYDKVLKTIGVSATMFDDDEKYALYSPSSGTDKPVFPFIIQEGAEPTASAHICFLAGSRALVDEAYKSAIELGAKENGGPGIREMYGKGYYAAFVLDCDGSNIEFLYRDPEMK
ncbi:VOC family protein [Lipomyces oligophaga]|uniref:VOC family protein n=1 Tax=Lipomyces oligophaga TaxID=45792 RepID=UPI0034CF4AA2